MKYKLTRKEMVKEYEGAYGADTPFEIKFLSDLLATKQPKVEKQPTMKKKGQSYFDLPEKERRRILKAAGEHAQKMQQDLIKKADAMTKPSGYQEVEKTK